MSLKLEIVKQMTRKSTPFPSLHLDLDHCLNELIFFADAAEKARCFQETDCLRGYGILVEISTNINQVSIIHREVNDILDQMYFVLQRGLEKNYLTKLHIVDKKDNYIVVQTFHGNSVTLTDFFNTIKRFELCPVKNYVDFQQVVTKLLKNKVVVRELQKHHLKDDSILVSPTPFREVPNKASNIIRNALIDVLDDTLTYVVNFLYIIIKHGQNEYSLCLTFYHYINILLEKLSKVKRKLANQFMACTYIIKMQQKLQLQSLKDLIQGEKDNHLFSFICRKKYIDIFKTIDLLLKINPKFQHFQKELSSTYPRYNGDLTSLLSSNELFQRIKREHQLKDEKLVKLVDWYHCYYYYHRHDWETYFTTILINYGIRWDLFDFRQIIRSGNINAVIYYIINHDSLSCQVEEIIDLLYLLRTLDKSVSKLLMEIFLKRLPLIESSIRVLIENYQILSEIKVTSQVKKFLSRYFVLEVRNVNIIDFIIALWKIFPSDHYIPLYGILDLEVPEPEVPDFDEVKKLFRNSNTLIIQRLGNKSLNFSFELDEFYQGHLNFSSIIFAYFDKCGYCFGHIDNFIWLLRRSLGI